MIYPVGRALDDDGSLGQIDAGDVQLVIRYTGMAEVFTTVRSFEIVAGMEGGENPGRGVKPLNAGSRGRIVLRLSKNPADEKLFEVPSAIQHSDDSDNPCPDTEEEAIRGNHQFPVFRNTEVSELGDDSTPGRQSRQLPGLLAYPRAEAPRRTHTVMAGNVLENILQVADRDLRPLDSKGPSHPLAHPAFVPTGESLRHGRGSCRLAALDPPARGVST